MRPNRLRELLQSGQPSLGTRLQIAWPTIIELAGHSGQFDYVEITAEYAPYDLFTLENQGRAIDLFPHMTGMIKVGQEMRMHLAARAISSGIQNLLFADIRTAADAEECVKAVRAETPELRGLRGVGQGRDVGVVREIASPAFVQASADAIVALMIEKKAAIENLEAILAVEGVDMVQFGPADYAVSMGLVGQKQHPAIREAECYMIRTAQRMGVTPRAEIWAPTGDRGAERYLDLGVRHFCMGTDVRTLYQWFSANGRQMRDMLPAPQPGAGR